MDYKIDPGLYALGLPDEASPVLVSANYKLSFDHLREAIPDQSFWILVLDTDGVNVWCAAGRGTFGTEELLRRIESTGLAQVVSHRDLVLPQLSAPGVSAHQVHKRSGFKVVYGPIRAVDLPRFIDNGLRATPQMRIKTFNLSERAVLIPVELVETIKPGILLMAAFFVAGGLAGPEEFWKAALNHGLFAVCCLAAAIVSGAVLTPLFLPWLPGRAFSLKGAFMGLVMTLLLWSAQPSHGGSWSSRLEIGGWFFLIPAISAFIAMNFTGASTYTSLSGVKKEMKWSVPLQIVGAFAGLMLWLGSRLIA
jgi:acetyl-CoA decarbonylase/synthase complex subunit gamma